MRTDKQRCAVLVWTALSCCLTLTVWAGDTDIYLVYSGKNRSEKVSLEKALSKQLTTKSYNVSLLALADYSGKQKAVAKLERAKVVVVLADTPFKLLKGTTLKRDVLVVKSVKKGIDSDTLFLRIFERGTNLEGIDPSKTLTVSSFEDLEDSSAIRHASLIEVAPSLDFHEVVTRTLKQIVESQR